MPAHTGLEHSLLLLVCLFFQRDALLQTTGAHSLSLRHMLQAPKEFLSKSERAQAQKEVADSGAKQQPCGPTGLALCRDLAATGFRRKGRGYRKGSDLAPTYVQSVTWPHSLSWNKYTWKAAWGKSPPKEKGMGVKVLSVKTWEGRHGDQNYYHPLNLFNARDFKLLYC